jgi:hypothetical protein
MNRLFFLILISVFISSSSFAQTLTVSGNTPVKNGLDIPINSNIVITFNKNIRDATVGAATFNINGSMQGLLGGIYSVNTNTITFNPNTDFKPGEIITVTLTTSIQASDDAFLANDYTFQFSVEAPTGYGSFNSPINISTTADGAYCVEVADMDGDGDLDIVSTSYMNYSIDWYENGNSWNKTNISNSAGYSESISVVDLDGDGDMDVVSANNYDSRLEWFENGNSWNKTVIAGSLDGIKSVASADLDGDGDLDIITATGNDVDKISWFENGNTWNRTDISTGEDDPGSVRIGDMDNDGDLDVVAAI